jgi:arsenate reductase (thioredoxin)
VGEPVKIYFICIFNRARSQIAEAFAKKYGGDRVEVSSAGVDGAREIHPMTIEVMKEVGIDISQNKSKKINMKTFVSSNVIVKLCEGAHERRPIVPFGIQNDPWYIMDLVPKIGSKPDMKAFRKVRDEIEGLVKGLLHRLKIRETV